eukprot:scaffold17271_cov69-Cyclotella_meneghiniana.AAC.11
MTSLLHQTCVILTILSIVSHQTNATRSESHSRKYASPIITPSIIPLLRGGSSDPLDINDTRTKQLDGYNKLLKYRSDQQLLYQLRSTYLSELLAQRGVPLPTVTSVGTVEGEKPPEKVDWDCALSTANDPKTCLYSFDAEPNTKVLAPLGTTQYISLSALNRLRRTDPLKVEPMWHSQYAILQSWFSDASEYSILQHVGIKGFMVSSLLDHRLGLRSLLVGTILSILVVFMPILELIVGRILVSAPFWSQWKTWGRIVRAGFPLKLLLGQLAWKGIVGVYSKLEEGVRDYFVDLECEILEESVPLTVGVEAEEEDEVEESDEVYDNDDDMYDDDDES